MWCDKIPNWVVTCIGFSWAVIIAAAVGLFEIALYSWSRWNARRTTKRKIIEVLDRAARGGPSASTGAPSDPK
jgi:hypothetical protein